MATGRHPGSGLARTGRSRCSGPARNPARRTACAGCCGAEVLLPAHRHAVRSNQPNGGCARTPSEWKLLNELKSRIDSSPSRDSDTWNCWTPTRRRVGAGLEMRRCAAGRRAGIVDGDALRLNLRIDAENRGAFVTEDSRLIAAYPMARGFELDLAGQPGELTTLRCDILINAAEEVESYQIATRINGMKPHMPAGMQPSPANATTLKERRRSAGWWCQAAWTPSLPPSSFPDFAAIAGWTSRQPVMRTPTGKSRPRTVTGFAGWSMCSGWTAAARQPWRSPWPTP